ncbi:MAG: ribulose-phosphate 3-epimerase [Coprobacillus sp.]
MVKVAPSVLSANFAELKKDLDSIKEAGADWVHYDVMDGHFVPNISFGYSILKDISKVTDLFLDVHLMISDPRKYVDEFIQAGADMIVFHIEAVDSKENVNELIEYIHSQNVQVGISIKPATSVNDITDYLNRIDLVLVMSVEPGFGGQSFQEGALDKIKELSELQSQYNYLIEVDGGINEVTGKSCKDAGVDVLVAGSYVFNQEDRKKAIDSLK